MVARTFPDNDRFYMKVSQPCKLATRGGTRGRGEGIWGLKEAHMQQVVDTRNEMK